MEDIAFEIVGDRAHLLIVAAPPQLAHETADPLRLTVARRLPDVDAAAVILDMTGVQMISSIGVAALLQLQEFCRDRRAGFVLANLPQRQQEFLTMLHLSDRFIQTRSQAQAIELLEEAGPEPPA